MYIRFGGGWRLLAGLLAGATVGAVMGQGFELIPSAVSLLAACTAGLIGVLATLILRAGTPRRERPSRAGATVLMVLLASYLVVGRLVWTNLGALEIFSYLAAGCVMTWLVFTSLAESPLLTAFGLGGLLGAACGVLVPMVAPTTFDPLFSLLTQAHEKSIGYGALSLLCAFAGAFTAMAGRLSGFGLAESRHDDVWRFNPEGRLATGKEKS